MRSRLRSGEELIVEVRHHPVALAGPAALVLFLLGALIAALMTRQPAWRTAAGAALLAGGAWALWRWIVWRADLWAVTSQRVIDESGVLTVRMSDTPLETINNVGCRQSVFGRILGFGSVEIQSAAERGAVVIDRLAQPEALRDAILEMRERRRPGGGGGYGAGAGYGGGAGYGARSGGGPAEAAFGGAGGASHSGPAGDQRDCPFCAERIKMKAKVCRFCGREVA